MKYYSGVHIKFFSSIERVDVTDKLFCTSLIEFVRS